MLKYFLSSISQDKQKNKREGNYTKISFMNSKHTYKIDHKKKSLDIVIGRIQGGPWSSEETLNSLEYRSAPHELRLMSRKKVEEGTN